MRNATYVAARLARAWSARRAAALLLAGCAGPVFLVGCASAGPGSPAVPAVAQSSGGTAAGQGGAGQGGAGQGSAGQGDTARAAALHPAPLSAIQQACGALAARAGLNPADEPPAPPQLVEAGVRAARCMRAHGLPDDQDPSARTPYTPGHGFGMTAAEMPAGGKASPVYQRAAQACRSLLDAEIRASTMASLGHDG
jgi:hypothetical protein